MEYVELGFKISKIQKSVLKDLRPFRTILLTYIHHKLKSCSQIYSPSEGKDFQRMLRSIPKIYKNLQNSL
jgi:hypothetical protein